MEASAQLVPIWIALQILRAGEHHLTSFVQLAARWGAASGPQRTASQVNVMAGRPKRAQSVGLFWQGGRNSSPRRSHVTELAPSIDLRPHPRVLSVLGDIEFAPWQCIAELVDNSFDEFLRHPTRDERSRVNITLPGRTSRPSQAEVWITDNGPGLTLDQLQNALRAGWTSNDRHGHLGLFGMGFNIATARMGNVTVVKTARAEDLHWTIVTIDLPAMQRAGHFDVPVRTEPKSHPGEHGTEIVVRDLKPALHDQLSRNSKRLRDTLGDVYSFLLTERDFELTVDSTAVQPRRPCVWAPERYVVRGGQRIPALIEIDEPLGDRLACLDCGTWQDDIGESECQHCRGQRLQSRERRIWGWLGIQRYTDKTDFGIDFIRNGRKILLRDKTLFDWFDPDDPTASGEREYPVEVPNEGRIVGQIHVDHLWVPYQKNAFETASRDWTRVRRILRGEAPLRPNKARDLGYPQNVSPLAQLFTGYRRTDPGLKYLVPGDGKTALLSRAREWAERFRKGDGEYQTDQCWYEQAALHDRPAPEPETSPESGEDAFARAGLDDGPKLVAPPPPATVPAQTETEDQRRKRWRSSGAAVPDLQTSFGLRGRGSALQVTGAWRVTGQRGLIGPPDRPGRPVYIGAGRGAQVEIYIDEEHSIFTDFAVDVRDLVTFSLADYLRIREGAHDDLGTLFAQLKEQCLSDQRVTGPFLKESADALLDRIREAMAPIVLANSAGYWALLLDPEKAATQQRFVAENGRGSWDDTIAEGCWLGYAPAKGLLRLLKGRPDAFMDGQVFSASYATLTDAEAQRAGLDRVTDLLSDVAALSDQPVRRRSEELQRGRLSISLLSDELSESA
jgi:hypothetical protein